MNLRLMSLFPYPIYRAPQCRALIIFIRFILASLMSECSAIASREAPSINLKKQKHPRIVTMKFPELFYCAT